MLTVTFYGLAISFAGFLTALYVWYMGLTWVTIGQGIVFALVTLVASYYLPRILIWQVSEHLQWLDTYLGEKRKVKKVGEDYKVVLDGVDYLIDIDGVQSGDRVELTSRKGSIFHGQIIS
jgi:hypothetical protein